MVRSAACTFLTLCLVAAGAAGAQEAVNYASVSGRVTDSTGAALQIGVRARF
jgi:hypothetical protein